MWASLAVTLPTFILSLLSTLTLALIVTFFRGTYIDTWAVVICVAMMSISSLFFIIFGQYLFSKLWHLVPVSGYGEPGAPLLARLHTLVLPALVLGLLNSALIIRFTRASMLDVLGDLALVGHRIHGKVIACKSGHALNAALARRIVEDVRRSVDDDLHPGLARIA